MTIYNFNLGIGWASSGVEYAQAYRANVFRELKQDAKFIFMDMILADNIEHLTANIGLKDEEIIWFYNYFTDIKIAETSTNIKTVLDTIEGTPIREERDGKVLRYFYENEKFVTLYLRYPDQDIVEYVEHVSRGNLIKKDYFSYTKYLTEYFAPKDGVAKLYQRRFFNEDGSVAYDMMMNDKNDAFYRFPDQIFYSTDELIEHFVKSLHFTKDDIVILDRSTTIGQMVFKYTPPAKLGIVVHAEHYAEASTNDDYILWNNYYDYQFINADKVDFFITATQAQNDILAQQFKKYTPFEPKIYTIPVGSLDALSYPEGPRKPYSAITASRLASEKHIDWLVKSVVEAKRYLPELSLDIYGKGGEETMLKQLIEEHHAEDYIRLMGHVDLAQVYTQYDFYLAGSTSEGFGLTLLEAVGSGLPIIGFDVPYGNQTFIKNGVNGFIFDKSTDNIEKEIVENFSQSMIKLYQNEFIAQAQAASYEVAKPFLTEAVRAGWQQLIEEVLHA